jgi:hypothetical protein
VTTSASVSATQLATSTATSAPSGSNVPAIVGGTVGGVAGLAIIGAVLFHFLHGSGGTKPVSSGPSSGAKGGYQPVGSEKFRSNAAGVGAGMGGGAGAGEMGVAGGSGAVGSGAGYGGEVGSGGGGGHTAPAPPSGSLPGFSNGPGGPTGMESQIGSNTQAPFQAPGGVPGIGSAPSWSPPGVSGPLGPGASGFQSINALGPGAAAPVGNPIMGAGAGASGGAGGGAFPAQVAGGVAGGLLVGGAAGAGAAYLQNQRSSAWSASVTSYYEDPHHERYSTDYSVQTGRTDWHDDWDVGVAVPHHYTNMSPWDVTEGYYGSATPNDAGDTEQERYYDNRI